MIIFINDKKKIIPKGTTISIFLQEINTTINKGMAVAVNESVIYKKEWDNFILHENDKILLITATQGG